MQKVRLAALSLQCSSAPPSVLARRSCARFADAGVPGLLLLLCVASGLELPQMRALSIAVAIALRRHVRSCSPRVLHHTHPVDLACFVQVSMSAIQRGAVVVWHAVLPLENSVVHKIFSRGCAPHPLSLETRFSLYHIKVLHLLANRLLSRRFLALLALVPPAPTMIGMAPGMGTAGTPGMPVPGMTAPSSSRSKQSANE